MSLIGTQIQPFSVEAFDKFEFKTITDQDLKGKWSVIFFYPADFTFVCPTELEDLAENYAEFQKLGCEIYSVSTDTHFTHKAWHDTSEAIKKVEPTVSLDEISECEKIREVFKGIKHQRPRVGFK